MTKKQRKDFVRRCKALAEQHYPKLHWRSYEHMDTFILEGSVKPYDGRFESFFRMRVSPQFGGEIVYRDERSRRSRRLRYLTSSCFLVTLRDVFYVIYRGINRERNDYFTAATKRMEAFRATT